MFGAAMVVAAVVAAAQSGAVVHGEMGVVLAKPSTATTPASTATPAPNAAAAAAPPAAPAPIAAPPAAEAAAPAAVAEPGAAAAAEPGAESAPAAVPDATPSTSTATSTTTATTTATATGAPAPAAPPAPAAALPGAAPSGPPLADSVPVVIARRTWRDGGATERIIEPSGDLVLHVLSPAGTVLSCTKVGSLYTLPIESQTDAAYGEVVHLVRDDSGALIRYVVQADGEPRAVAVLEPARLSMQ